MTGPKSPMDEGGAAIAVTPAGATDLDALSTLHGQCFDIAWSAREFSELLASPSATALLARNTEQSDERCGFILLQRAADEAEIITLGVVPSSRRRGVATALLATALGLLEAEVISSIFLEVAEDDAAARGFYRVQGFRDVGRRDGYYGAMADMRRDAVIMCRVVGGGR